MHIIKKVSAFLVIFFCAFVMGVYYEKLVDSFYPYRQENLEPINHISLKTDEEITPALQSEEVITANTKLIIIEHNLEDGSEVCSENNIPIKYIGLNRKRFLEEMEIYELSPALTDIKKGFLSLEVVSFSKAENKLQKNYSADTLNLHFYILAKDNKLVVYYEDLETVYLSTDIAMDSLPKDVQLEILKKKYFESEEELYNFLESYSS